MGIGEPSLIMATFLKMATSRVPNELNCTELYTNSMYPMTFVQVVSMEKDGEPSPFKATFLKMATSTVYKGA